MGGEGELMFFKNLTAMVHKPHYKNVYLYPASEDLSHIPDSGTNVVLEAPVEALDGELTTFTFSATPKYLMLNGTWLVPNVDYTVAGLQATLTEIIPATGDTLRAVI
jgi:hypothetical protein